MANNKGKGLHITKYNLFTLIADFLGTNDIKSCIVNEEVKNAVNNQTRYEFRYNEIYFTMDVYYKSDKTLTLSPLGDQKSKEICDNLIDFVYDSIEFKDVRSGIFVCLIGNQEFEDMIEYLSTLEGVSKSIDEDRAANGRLIRFESEIGDKITLTYYSTKCKLMFQGFMMRLYIEIKCFMSALSVTCESETNNCARINISDDAIIKHLKMLVPNSYLKLHDYYKDLLFDSVSLILNKPNTRDYSVWTFSALKALEGRIKEVFSFEHIQIGNAFVLGGVPLFKLDNFGKYRLNKSIVSITDGNTITDLENCYDYYHKFRHVLFHTRQSLESNARIYAPAFAEDIVNNVCQLFDITYNVLGK